MQIMSCCSGLLARRSISRVKGLFQQTLCLPWVLVDRQITVDGWNDVLSSPPLYLTLDSWNDVIFFFFF